MSIQLRYSIQTSDLPSLHTYIQLPLTECLLINYSVSGCFVTYLCREFNRPMASRAHHDDDSELQPHLPARLLQAIIYAVRLPSTCICQSGRVSWCVLHSHHRGLVIRSALNHLHKSPVLTVRQPTDDSMACIDQFHRVLSMLSCYSKTKGGASSCSKDERSTV